MGCRARKDQTGLVRLARVLDGGTGSESVAVGHTLPGRGAWLCAGSSSCVDGALRRGVLARALRCQLDQGAIDRLRSDFVRFGSAVRDWTAPPAGDGVASHRHT
ncbi:MAG: YlxR family protein [Acidimicrobiales bacterium]